MLTTQNDVFEACSSSPLCNTLVLVQANINSIQSQISQAKDEIHGPGGELAFQDIEDSLQDTTVACSKVMDKQGP
jgi:hypothetical protein